MAEKEYIEREAATTLFARACGECKEACEEFDGFYADCNQCLLHGVLKEFATLPAADVRHVVFCRDCDCWNEWDSAERESLGNYVCSCAHWSVEDGPVLYTRPADFCSYGEKREES